MVRRTGRLLTENVRWGKAARLIAGGALAASALLWLPQPAQAGRWGFDRFEVTGYRKTFKENDPEATKTEPQPSSFPLYPGSSTASLPTTTLSVGPVAGVAASATQQATVRVVLKWTRYGYTQAALEADNPPDVVWIKVVSSAHGEAIGFELDSSHSQADKEHVSAMAGGKAGEPAPSAYGTAETARSVKLIPIVTNGEDEVKSPPVSLYAYAGIDGSRVLRYEYVDDDGNTVTEETPFDGSVSTGIGYTASFDNRGVWIDSPIHMSYHKGAALPEPINGQTHMVVPNLRKPDLSVLADSVINWDEAHGWVGGDTFIAEHPNFTSPSYQWNVTGSGEPVTIWDQEEMKSTRKQTTFKLLFSTNPNLTIANKANVIKVDVIDGADGAKGTNTFTVRWHLPFENWVRYKPDQEIWDYPSLNVDSPGYAMYGGGVMCHWNYEHCYWGDVADALTSVAGSMVAPPWSGLFAAAGVSVDSIGPKPDSNTANFDACWGKDGSGYHPSRDDADKARYEMLPILRIGYTNRFLEGEVYASSGYMNQKKKVVQVFDGRREFVGEFHKVEVDPTAP